MDKRDIGVVILAGGGARRMGGVNKALLQWNGRSFLEWICDALCDFDERFLSVANDAAAPVAGLTAVPDVYPDSGPLGGVYSALLQSKKEALLVVPCDSPLFDRAAADALCESFDPESDDVLVFHDGHLQPLCGIYAKTCIPAMKRCLDANDCCIMSIYDHLRMRTLPTKRHDVFTNVNAPADLQALNDNSSNKTK